MRKKRIRKSKTIKEKSETNKGKKKQSSEGSRSFSEPVEEKPRMRRQDQAWGM